MKPALFTVLAFAAFGVAAYTTWCVRWERALDRVFRTNGRAL